MLSIPDISEWEPYFPIMEKNIEMEVPSRKGYLGATGQTHIN